MPKIICIKPSIFVYPLVRMNSEEGRPIELIANDGVISISVKYLTKSVRTSVKWYAHKIWYTESQQDEMRSYSGILFPDSDGIFVGFLVHQTDWYWKTI